MNTQEEERGKRSMNKLEVKELKRLVGKRFTAIKLGKLIAVSLLILFGVTSIQPPAKAENLWKPVYPYITSCFLNDLYVAAPDDIHVVGLNNNGAIIGHYNGDSWENMEVYPSAELTAIWGASAENIYAVGYNIDSYINNIYSTLILHYDGAKWSEVEFSIQRCLLNVWGGAEDDIFAVGEQGLIVHWDGSSWEVMDSGTTAELYGVWGDGQGTVYAVGMNVILCLQNNAWTVMENVLPYFYYLNDIWGIPGGDILAVGTCILRFHQDQGIWLDETPYDFPSDFSLWGISGVSETEIMAVGYRYHSDDYSDSYEMRGLITRYDGTKWNVEEGTFPSGFLNKVWLGENNQALVVGGNAPSYFGISWEEWMKGIILSFNDDSWALESTQSYEGTFTQLWAKSNEGIYIVGGYPALEEPYPDELKKVYIARYNGQTWTQQQVNEEGFLNDIWGSPDGKLFAVGGNVWSYDVWPSYDVESVILYSEDGSSWESMSDNFEDMLFDVWGVSSNNVWAVGDNIYHYNGNNWSNVFTPSLGSLGGIWGTDEGNIYAVGGIWDVPSEKATILHYNGDQWVEMDHEIVGYLEKVWGTSPDNVFAVGQTGIYHFDDYSQWSSVATPSEGCFFDIWGTSSDNVFAASDSGLIHFDGTSWKDTGYQPDYFVPMLGLGGASGSGVLAVGEWGTALHFKGDAIIDQKIVLNPGWNLVSFQINMCIHETPDPPEVFIPENAECIQVEDLTTFFLNDQNSPIRTQDLEKAGNWQQIISYDKNGPHTIDKNLPPQIHDMQYFSAGYGYWIKMNSPGYLLVSGKMLPSNNSWQLYQGWNLIGCPTRNTCYYDTTEKPSSIMISEEPLMQYTAFSGQLVQKVFSSISGYFQQVIGYDNGGPKTYDINIPEQICDLHYLAPGYGYWIRMDEEGVLTFP